MKIIAAVSYLTLGFLALACSSDPEPALPAVGGSPAGGAATGGAATGGVATGGTGGASGGMPAKTYADAPGMNYVKDAGLKFGTGVFSYKDTPKMGETVGTIIGITNPTPGEICAAGFWTPGTDWGAGIGIDLKTGCGEMDQSTCVGFDSTKYGIAGVSFTLSKVPTSAVRFGVSTIPAGDGPYNPGIDGSGDYVADGTYTVMFTEISQASWVRPMTPWDPTVLSGLQFQVNSAPVGGFEACVSDVKFVDANMMEVVVPAEAWASPATGTGGAGGMGAGGMGAGGMGAGGMGAGGMGAGGAGGGAAGGAGGEAAGGAGGEAAGGAGGEAAGGAGGEAAGGAGGEAAGGAAGAGM